MVKTISLIAAGKRDSDAASYGAALGNMGYMMLNITVRRSSDHSRMRYQEGATGKRDDECLGKSIHMHAVICGISACHLSVSELVSETVRGQALWACRCCCAPAVVSRVNTLHTTLSTPDKSISDG